MKVKDAMTSSVEYLPADTTIETAAKKMASWDCGFLPIAERGDEKLQGVITDRDITIRAVAEGKDPAKTTVEEICSTQVLYCFQDDDLEEAAKSMQDQAIYRLIVLDNAGSKQLAGVLTVGDILRKGKKNIAADVARDIASAA